MKNFDNATLVLHILSAFVILSITMVCSILFIGINDELGNVVSIPVTVAFFGIMVTATWVIFNKFAFVK